MTARLDRLPPQESARLSLRPLTLADAEAFRAMTDEPSINAVVHFLASPFTRKDSEALLRGAGDGADCFWGVWPRAGGALLGTVGTHLHGEGEIEIGYWFAAAARGQGFAGEAVQVVTAALATAFPARQIIAECRPENTASWRLLTRLGFRPSGTAGHRPGRARLVLGGWPE
ncbi:GNAT family N-acetyltransferase [Acidisoma sp. 7E03]